MRNTHVLLLLLGCSLLSALTGCETDVDVNADQKPIYVVYGVLDPTESTQYIRLGRGFQTEENAIEIAASKDLSMSGAVVELRAEGEPTIRLREIDTTKQAGNFDENVAVYATDTPIAVGKAYELRVTPPNDTSKVLTATTRVPDPPFITNPEETVTIGGATEAREEVDFTESFELAFREARPPDTVDRFDTVYPGAAYEVRTYFRYGIKQSTGDTAFQAPIRMGPLGPFEEDNCQADPGSLCRRLSENQMIGFYRRELPESSELVYETRDVNPKTKAFGIEVTSLSQPLFDYIRINNPAFASFNTVPPDFTNLELANGDPAAVRLAGVFGAVNKDINYVSLDACTEFNLNLNGTARPSNCDRIE